VFKYCINILNEGRIGIAAQQIGIAKGCMDIAMPHLADRTQFGQPIGSFQVSITTIVRIRTFQFYVVCEGSYNIVPYIMIST
jgi:short-chain 2-methylacyl-CoA dehydrogenase